MMTALVHLSESAAVHVVGWTLVHFLWQGSLIAIALRSLLAVLSTQSAQLRYRITCFALLLMISLPPFTLHRLLVTGVHSVVTGHNVAVQPTSLQIAKSVAPEIAIRYLAPVEDAMNRTIPWILLTWPAGTFFLLARLWRGLRATQTIKRFHGQPLSAELEDLWMNLKMQLRIRRVRLVLGTIFDVPTAIGWRYPVIFLPVAILGHCPISQIKAVLAHELGHVRRQDFLVNLLQSAVEAIFFFHPAVWWVSTQVRKEREHCCDDIAISIGIDRFAYARTLAILEERRAPVSVAALGVNGGMLASRIRRLLTRSETRPYFRVMAGIAFVSIVVTATWAYTLPWMLLLGSGRSSKQTQDENLTAKERADIQHYGISPSFLRAVDAVGLGRASVDELVRLKQYAVSPAYATAIARTHLDELTFEEIIRFNQYGVSPEYANGMSSAGFRDPEQIVSFQQQGITVSQVNELRAAGFRGLSPQRAVSRTHSKQQNR